MPEKGVDHTAVDETKCQPHQHGHDVLSQRSTKDVFGCTYSTPIQGGEVGGEGWRAQGRVYHLTTLKQEITWNERTLRHQFNS